MTSEDGEGVDWEEGEPTDFVYTGLFPGETKGWGGGGSSGGGHRGSSGEGMEGSGRHRQGGRGEGVGGDEEEEVEDPVLLFEDETAGDGLVRAGVVESVAVRSRDGM